MCKSITSYKAVNWRWHVRLNFARGYIIFKTQKYIFLESINKVNQEEICEI